jgi:ribosomal protein L37AE/L43A
LLLFGAIRMVSGALGEGFLVMLVGLVSIFGAFALAIVAELGRADSPEQREAILRFAELFFGKSVGGGRTGGGQASGSQPDGGQTSVSATDRQPTHTSEGTSDEGVLGFSGFTNIGNSDPSSSGLIDKYQAIRNAPQYPSSPKCPRCETQKVRSIDDGVWQCSNGHTFETNPSHKREYDINVQHDE